MSKAQLGAFGFPNLGRQRVSVRKPEVTSSNVATSQAAGVGITYTATSDVPQAKWLLVDDFSIGLTIDYDTGVVSGGAGASAGSYMFEVIAADVFGRSEGLLVSWDVT